MNIAILGFGTVGSGVYKIIKNAKRQAQNLHVKHILIRKNKKPDLPEMTDSIDEILNDKDVDVVVEVIGGIEPAHQYIVDALKHKKHVITANKAVIAQYMDEFTKVLLKMTPSSTLNQASVVGSHGFKVWKEHCESTM